MFGNKNNEKNNEPAVAIGRFSRFPCASASGPSTTSGLTVGVDGFRIMLPSRAEPSRAEPSRAEPSRAEPSRAEPSRAEPSRAEPSRAEPSRAALFTPYMASPPSAFILSVWD